MLQVDRAQATRMLPQNCYQVAQRCARQFSVTERRMLPSGILGQPPLRARRCVPDATQWQVRAAASQHRWSLVQAATIGIHHANGHHWQRQPIHKVQMQLAANSMTATLPSGTCKRPRRHGHLRGLRPGGTHTLTGHWGAKRQRGSADRQTPRRTKCKYYAT